MPQREVYGVVDQTFDDIRRPSLLTSQLAGKVTELESTQTWVKTVSALQCLSHSQVTDPKMVLPRAYESDPKHTGLRASLHRALPRLLMDPSFMSLVHSVESELARLEAVTNS